MSKNIMIERNPLYKHVKQKKGHTISEFCRNTGIENSTAVKLLYSANRIPQIQILKMIWDAYPEFSPNEMYKWKGGDA